MNEINLNGIAPFTHPMHYFVLVKLTNVALVSFIYFTRHGRNLLVVLSGLKGLGMDGGESRILGSYGYTQNDKLGFS